MFDFVGITLRFRGDTCSWIQFERCLVCDSNNICCFLHLVYFHFVAFSRKKESLLQPGCASSKEGFCLCHQSTKAQKAKHENGKIQYQVYSWQFSAHAKINLSLRNDSIIWLPNQTCRCPSDHLMFTPTKPYTSSSDSNCFSSIFSFFFLSIIISSMAFSCCISQVVWIGSILFFSDARGFEPLFNVFLR